LRADYDRALYRIGGERGASGGLGAAVIRICSNLKNAVETTDFTNSHGYSIKSNFLMIHPVDKGISVDVSPGIISVSVVISEIRGEMDESVEGRATPYRGD